MKAPKPTKFHMFRYQIVPITQDKEIQLTFLNQKITSKEELIKIKNDLFVDALTSIKPFTYSLGNILHTIKKEGNCFILQLAPKRTLRWNTPEFTEEEIDNWPNVHIVINNDPLEQTIAIEKTQRAFEKTSTVRKILEENLNRYLMIYQIQAHIFPIVEKHEFWAIVDKHENEIIRVDFDMVSPNMAAISKALDDTFKQFIKDTNSQDTHIVVESDKESHVVLRKSNIFLNGIVNYILQGCGNISVKIRKSKKIITTANSVTETTINDISINNCSPKELVNIINRQMNE